MPAPGAQDKSEEEDSELEYSDLVCFVWRGFFPRFSVEARRKCVRAHAPLRTAPRVARRQAPRRELISSACALRCDCHRSAGRLSSAAAEPRACPFCAGATLVPNDALLDVDDVRQRVHKAYYDSSQRGCVRAHPLAPAPALLAARQ